MFGNVSELLEKVKEEKTLCVELKDVNGTLKKIVEQIKKVAGDEKSFVVSVDGKEFELKGGMEFKILKIS